MRALAARCPRSVRELPGRRPPAPLAVAWLLMAVAALLVPGAALAAAPPHVVAVDNAPRATGSPADDGADWLLAFIDVETTGLVPGWHEMIDIGVVMAGLDGDEIEALHLRIQPEHPERTSDGARRVNGFDAERWRAHGALPAPATVATLRTFHQRVAGGRPVLFVAFNSPFDAAFLDHLFRAADGSWRELYHYFVLDIPSMAWALGLRGLTGTALAQALGVPDEPRVADQHTGLTGARLNARLYRAIEARRAPAPAQ
jgi:DNA polymerase III epsilon subunit-like protein